MWAGWQSRQKQIVKTIEDLSKQRIAQLVLAIALALGHVFMFAQAARSRLDIPFNLAPGTHLEFADPMAPALGPLPRQPANWSRLAMSRFDTQHYVGTALRGLSACPSDPAQADGRVYLQCGLGWLPAYGAVGGVVSSITGWEPDVALVMISIICAVVLNMLWVCPTMIKRLGRFEAFAVLIAWNCYPTSWNVVVPGTESAVCALAIGGFIMLANERWVWSAVLIGACTALRIPTASFAFALGCALLLAAWERRKAKTPQWWKPLVAVPLCGWGQFLTMAVLQIKLGNWHAFFDARFAFGDHNRLDRLDDATYYVKGFASQTSDMTIYVGLLAIMALTWKRVMACFDRVEAAFLGISSVATMILSVIAAMQYYGITRYMMLCPMAFLGAGVLGRHHRAAFVLWLVLCCAFYWHLELCSYITQGDPRLCPCLGRVELHMPWAS